MREEFEAILSDSKQKEAVLAWVEDNFANVYISVDLAYNVDTYNGIGLRPQANIVLTIVCLLNVLADCLQGFTNPLDFDNDDYVVITLTYKRYCDIKKVGISNEMEKYWRVIGRVWEAKVKDNYKYTTQDLALLLMRHPKPPENVKLLTKAKTVFTKEIKAVSALFPKKTNLRVIQ
ncbi:hypothetical protein [Endozoicomonas sp. ONNA1]|uniref:hypothetical protein n=1 Tax=Endozoicomonas sp. ONNA1 TaxID=2828740 RepID=UPI0021488EA8|nr:hypothetical protein [Endozoicomonas sp. ONNA1]